MAKQKNPRLTNKPISASKYVVETITREPGATKSDYHYFQTRHDADVWAGSERGIVRIFRMDYKLVKKIGGS
jgi:hypothetical protein